MDPSPLLQRLMRDLEPSEAQRTRVHAMLTRRMRAERSLREIHTLLTPTEQQRQNVWLRISERVLPERVITLLEQLRDLLTPSDAQATHARAVLFAHLRPVHVPVWQRSLKWASALAIILVVVQLSQLPFFAPRTIAESSVLVLPRGEVSTANGGLWLPVAGEFSLQREAALRTDRGQATVTLHDDGNLRFGDHTSGILHDVTNRPEPALDGPTLTLQDGRLWAQAFVPYHHRPLIIATPHGTVKIHAGSVAIQVGRDVTRIDVWDRHATVTAGADEGDRELILVAGEWTEIQHDNAAIVKRLQENDRKREWVAQNIAKDAVHRREILQVQLERQVAKAGTLPTSPLYPLKRLKEQIEVSLTLDPQAKIEKQLNLASTRLSEAAVLLSEGDESATEAVEEYRSTMLAVASGTGGNSVAEFLLRQEIAENTAELSVARPDDEIYPLKVAVLETSVEVPGEIVDAASVEEVILTDTIETLQNAVESGDRTLAAEMYEEIKPQLPSLENEESGLSPEVRKDVLSSLQDVAEALEEDVPGTDPAEEELEEQIVREVRRVLPPKLPVLRDPLSAEQAQMIANGIIHRMDVYEMSQSQENQFLHDLKKVQADYPDAADQGAVLRRLFETLPVTSPVRDEVRRALGAVQ